MVAVPKQMKALKLDSTYRPIAVIDALEALVMCLIGKAKTIESYEGVVINSPTRSFSLPSVIVLNTIVKFKFTIVSCNRRNVVMRDRNICQYCGKTFTTEHLTMDHVLPKSRGGRNIWENLVAACRKCNQKKGCKTTKESGMHPLKEPVKPKPSILRHIDKEQMSDIWINYLWQEKI